MMRHWFASGLVLGTLFATATFAQVSSDPAAVNGQVSQLRPGWSRDRVDPATARERNVVSPAPTQVAQASESRSRSFLPNWFGWRYDKPDQQANSKSSQNNAGQSGTGNSKSNSQRPSAGKSGAPARTGAASDSSSMPPDPALMRDDPLPGLGGTPLPRANAHSSNADSNNKSNGLTAPGIQPRRPKRRPNRPRRRRPMRQA